MDMALQQLGIVKGRPFQETEILQFSSDDIFTGKQARLYESHFHIFS